jgi:uncharacterized protein YjiS (DUF1127 family)
MSQAQIFTAQPAHGSFSRRISDAVKGAWVGYWTHRAERATVFILHKLDDRTLKDIGMDRSEIESLVYARARDCFHSSGRRITMCVRA